MNVSSEIQDFNKNNHGVRIDSKSIPKKYENFDVYIGDRPFYDVKLIFGYFSGKELFGRRSY